jgi:hypothetical protein
MPERNMPQAGGRINASGTNARKTRGAEKRRAPRGGADGGYSVE